MNENEIQFNSTIIPASGSSKVVELFGHFPVPFLEPERERERDRDREKEEEKQNREKKERKKAVTSLHSILRMPGKGRYRYLLLVMIPSFDMQAFLGLKI